MASRFYPRVRRKCTVDAVGDGPAAHVKVKGVGVGQFKKLVVAVGALLGAGVVVDFGQDGVVPAGVLARLSIVGKQDSRGRGCPPCGCRSSRHGIGHAHPPSTASSGRQRPGGSRGASCFWRQECPKHVHVTRPFDRRTSSLQDCQVNDTGQWSLPKTSLWISACCTWGMARSLTSM